MRGEPGRIPSESQSHSALRKTDQNAHSFCLTRFYQLYQSKEVAINKITHQPFNCGDSITKQLVMAEQSLEQRIYDLLLPFRDECWTTSSSSAHGSSTAPPDAEHAALILCGMRTLLCSPS